MAEKLTAEQARTVKLPSIWHPLKRLVQLNEYGEALGLEHISGTIFPPILSRRDLVYHAEHEDQLEAVYSAINARREAQQTESAHVERIQGEQ